MSGRQKLSDEEREEARRLNREEGLSYAALAVRYKVDYRTISRICNPERYEEEKKRNAEYNKKSKNKILNTRKTNQRTILLLLTHSLDSDIIRFLDAKDNVNGYLKTLIRKDMEEGRPANSEKNDIIQSDDHI